MISIDNIPIRFRLRLMKISNQFALVGSVIAALVCFSDNIWFFVSFLLISLIYLGISTYRFIQISNDRCISNDKAVSYDRQVTTLQTRLSAVSNSMSIVVSVVFIIMEIKQELSGISYPGEAIANSYVSGFIRLIIAYIVVDKIHSSRILIQTYRQMANNLKHLNLGNIKDFGDDTSPIMYIDGFKISDKRYCSAICDNEVIVVFSPSLSLSHDSIIEYVMIPPEDPEKLYNRFVCDETGADCPRCNVVIKQRLKTCDDTQ